ncbi:hypothetical protein INT48_003024 [Thamnidium elegans]|uniref:Uncharacterized protein n=1 Tax=Thamnidium elegans TaxID=101142 RepID=A0A8H7SFJ9_9FUNG|nr:hypothetical protein INT48_003024 [Thamnidium elegans]
MTDGNEYPLDSLRFLQEFDLNPSLPDSVKPDTLIGEVREIKVMLSQLLALNSKSSSNSSSSGSGFHSTGTRSLLTTPASFEVLNDEFKINEIVSRAIGNRGKRIYTKNNVSVKTNIPQHQKKPSIIAICSLWLEAENILYDMSTAEENRETRWKDASDRYDKTNVVINLFCETKFSGEGPEFRWSKLSKEEQDCCVYVVEHIVLETLAPKFHLPLDVAKDSWATSHLLSVAIRNKGFKKAILNPIVDDVEGEDYLDSFSICDMPVVNEVGSQEVSDTGDSSLRTKRRRQIALN